MRLAGGIASLVAVMVVSGACGEEEQRHRRPGEGYSSYSSCGNGVRDGVELCDGADLGGVTCASLGLGGDGLACLANCGGFVTTGCTGCAPNCAGRVCGPDPVCGTSCGDCAGACDGAGQCTLSSDGPAFLSFDTNPSVLSETQTLAFTAGLTDPDGVSDLAGGTLVDPLSGSAYGAFVAAASAGSYTLSLTWWQINDVRPIDAATTGQTRAFRAEFYDQAGHKATHDVSVTLRCAQGGDSACAGECVDLETSEQHCGTCNSPVPGELQCVGGEPGCADPLLVPCGDFCCAAAPSCTDGVVQRAVVEPAPGDLVITEVLADASGTDAEREWVEVYVAAPSEIDLNGVIVTNTNQTPSTRTFELTGTECLSVAPDTYVVIAGSGATGDGVSPDVIASGFTLYNSASSLSLSAGNDDVIDSITYSTPVAGVSYSLDPSVLSASGNDTAGNWCSAPASHAPFTGLGSPGEANDACSSTEGWLCSPSYYGSNDGCDCGCGIADPDCGAGGCTSVGCEVDSCDYCFDGVTSAQCGIETLVKACLMSLGVGDGCDCGCGFNDADCGAGGCITAGCFETSCMYCSADGVMAVPCFP